MKKPKKKPAPQQLEVAALTELLRETSKELSTITNALRNYEARENKEMPFRQEEVISILGRVNAFFNPTKPNQKSKRKKK